MIEFRLPSLGADMDRGTLLEWRVQPGTAVKKGDVIAVVDTTKAAIDVESWHDGQVLELIAAPGDVLPVGALMAVLLEVGEDLAAARARVEALKAASHGGPVAAAPMTATVLAPAEAEAPRAARRVSPAARKRAADLGVDVGALAGTGPGGAVTLEDVERAAAPRDRHAEMRKTIAAAMARAKREIPHYYLYEDVAVQAASAWLRTENEHRPVTERILIAALYIKAVALAARKFSDLNGYWIDGGYRSAPAVHVGVAISLRQGGLIAPAIHDADRKTPVELMRALGDLVQRARAGSLRGSELTDPTITLTNLGEQSVTGILPIINPPQVAIVGVGKVSERPWVAGDRVMPMPVATVSLGADHRVSDGHRGALFLAEIRDLLQQPGRL
jgi:pyruvate dehydrogenase E2 component (dihydrolipoamide acetyltransferase)